MDEYSQWVAYASYDKVFAKKMEVALEWEKKQQREKTVFQFSTSTPTRPVRLREGSRWHNQRVEFLTSLFGKEYYWMRDGDGTVYLARVGKDGNPELL